MRCPREALLDKVTGRIFLRYSVVASVTRLGHLLHFGQLFKACGHNYFAQIAHIFMLFLVSKVSKSLIFLVKSFWATFIDIWRLFTGHTGCGSKQFFNASSSLSNISSFAGKAKKKILSAAKKDFFRFSFFVIFRN